MKYNVIEYGAIGDGEALNTIAVQKAIDACTLAGGTAAGDDALTTALLVMGESRAVKFINEHLKKK